MKFLNKTIWKIALISLFIDIASEMLYPIMPIYLESIGYSVIFIGILEGTAEALAGFSKGYFGKLSDQLGKRVPFIQTGYALSAISKPLIVLLNFPLWIFFARSLDRLGKGIRTGARDALLSQQATHKTKGKVFGFHRSMDTLGAVLGPGFALLFLFIFPQHYSSLFYYALIPGIIAVLISFLLYDDPSNSKRNKSKNNFFSFLKYWKVSSVQYKKITFGFLLFALFNSSDVFLILKAKQCGLSDSNVITIYIFYNLIYAIFAFPLGILADKTGMKFVYTTGLILFALTYAIMALTNDIIIIYLAFFIYGVFSAGTEGIAKAWITQSCQQHDTATAIGTYTAFQSICTMLASTLTGLIWYSTNSQLALLISSIATVLIAAYFMFSINQHNLTTEVTD